MKITQTPTIYRAQKQHASFKAAQFVNYNSDYNSIKAKLQQELEKFIAGNDNVSILGSGKFGETFRFTDNSLRNVVIKKSKGEYKDDYKLEYENLIKVPTDKVGGQAGIARAYNHKTKEYYLISTLTEGKEVSPYNRYTDSHLKSLFNKMFELDKTGLYHGDLNGKNILLTKSGEINFIDYQWAQKVQQCNFFDSQKSKQLLLPLSNFPENAQMFEMATMPYYIEQIGSQKEKEDFLRLYLKNKAEYHSKRHDYIKKLTEKWPYSSERSYIRASLASESAKSKVYRNPTDQILKLELKKLQFLSDYRDAYGHVDPNMLDRNILASSSSYLCSLSAVQDFRKEIGKQLRTCNDADLRAYLQSQLEYGNYWYEKLKSFSSDTFDYVMRAITKNLNADETKHKFYIQDRNPRFIKENKDILAAVDSRFHTNYDRNFHTQYNIKQTLHDIFSEPMDAIRHLTPEHLDSKAYHRRKKVQHAYGELKNFNNEGKVLDLLNESELITLKTREFYGYSYNNMSSVKLDRLLEKMLENATNFTENLYRTIWRGLSESNINSILVQGYENMRKFKTKI